MVCSRVNRRGALPPLVVVVVESHTRENTYSDEKAEQICTEADDWFGVSKALETVVCRGRFSMVQEMLLRPSPQGMALQRLVALVEYIRVTGYLATSMEGGARFS